MTLDKPIKVEEVKQTFHGMLTQTDKKDESVEFVVPSGQFWNKLSLKEQQELTDLVTSQGKDIDDLLYQMRQMLPRDPIRRRK